MCKIVFFLEQNQKLATKFARSHKFRLGKIEVTHFADGEVIAKTLTNVSDKEVIIIGSTSKSAVDNTFILLLLIDSMKRAGAKRIDLIIPYFGFSRQERVSWGYEPVSCEIVARMFDQSGVDSITIFDLHHPIIKTFFKGELHDVSTTEIFADYYEKLLHKKKISKNNVAIIAPDHGANKRAHDLAKALDVKDVVMLSKHRPKPNLAEVFFVEGNVKNKTCIIIDDIIDTGRTLERSLNVLYQQGAKRVFVGATHGVFSSDSLRLLLEANVKDICVSDSIEKELPSNVKTVSLKPLLDKMF